MEKLLTELSLRGFSEQTVKAYIYYNKLFLKYIQKDVDDIVEDDIRKYIAHLLSNEKYSAASVGLVKAALKFFYDEVLKKGIVTLRTPKMDKKLPVVLNKEEVSRLWEVSTSMLQFCKKTSKFSLRKLQMTSHVLKLLRSGFCVITWNYVAEILRR